MVSDCEENQSPNKEGVGIKKRDSTITQFLALPPTVRIIIYASFEGCIGQFGNSLLSSHPKHVKIAWFLIFLGVLLAATVVRLEITNHRNKHRISRGFSWVVFCALAIPGGAFCLWAALQEVEDIPAVIAVTLEPGETLNPKDPFSTRFKLRNTNPFSISNVIYVAVWVNGYTNESPRIFNFVSSPGYHIEKLERDASADLLLRVHDYPFQYPEAIAMQVWMFYAPGAHIIGRPQFNPEVFHFIARKDFAGNYKWILSAEPAKSWTSNSFPVLNPVKF